jgi:hypothetical protein
VVLLDLPARFLGGPLDLGPRVPGLRRSDDAAEPAVGEPSDPAQPGRGASAQPQVERTGGQRGHGRVVEMEEAPVVGDAGLAEQPAHDRERLVEQGGPRTVGHRVEATVGGGGRPHPERRQDPPGGERGQ